MYSVNEFLRNDTPPRFPPVYARDLESALYFSLSNGVQFIHGDLVGEKLEALREYITVLSKVFLSHHKKKMQKIYFSITFYFAVLIYIKYERSIYVVQLHIYDISPFLGFLTRTDKKYCVCVIVIS